MPKQIEEAKVEGKEEKDIEEAKVEDNKEEIKEEKKERKERTGIVYIYTSFNNTIVHVTDMAGNTISKASGGMATKQDRLKANPTVAMFVAKRAAEQAREAGINNVYVRIRAETGSTAPGPGAHAAVKSLTREGIRVISIVDTTKIARGGPKAAGGRRGRRV